MKCGYSRPAETSVDHALAATERRTNTAAAVRGTNAAAVLDAATMQERVSVELSWVQSEACDQHGRCNSSVTAI
jgi:hypothetical protein